MLGPKATITVRGKLVKQATHRKRIQTHVMTFGYGMMTTAEVLGDGRTEFKMFITHGKQSKSRKYLVATHITEV